MKILIDFTQIPTERTGVGVYADHLLRELPALLREDDTLYVLIQNDEKQVPLILGEHPQSKILKIPSRVFRNRAALLLFEQCVLPWMLLRHRVQVLHSLHYTFPIVSPAARAVTIHDLTFCLFPELHTRGRRLLFPFFIRRAMRSAESPIFVSHSTQQDAVRLFGPSQFPGHIAPLGVAPPGELQSLAQEQSIIQGLGIQRSFLLFLGTIEPRKNVLRLVRAFEIMADKHPEFDLVLAGKLGWHTADFIDAFNNSPVRQRMHHLGFVTEAHKRALLRSCEMLVYPSLYEGFGLPILEAMVYGTPVVTSNVSSLPEVCGDASIMIDPYSIDSIAAAIDKVVSDATVSSQLRQAGRVRAAGFTWARTARATHAAYRAAVR